MVCQENSARGLILFALISLMPFSGAAADEPPLPLGGEILIPDSVAGDQVAPDLASSADGGFIAVWQSLDEDGDGSGILAQAHGSDGAELHPALRVNLTTEGSQTRPAVSADDQGRFAIAWQGPQGESGTGVFVRTFGADGSPRTPEIAVSEASGERTEPSVALAENGDFLVAWQAGDGTGEGVWARLFASDGTPLTGELQLNTTTGGHQQNPQVRHADESGGYVVVWEGPDGSGSGIYLRHLAADGAFASGEIPVNEEKAGNQRNPALAHSGIDEDATDRNVFVVVWQSPDSAGTGIFARLYDDDGEPLGSQTLISQDNGNDQGDPSVAVDNGLDAGGVDFVVTWTEAPVAGFAGTEEHPVVVHGRRFGNAADIAAPEVFAQVFDVSEDGLSTGTSVVAAEDDGDFVVIWQSADQDGSGQGVMARRFAGQPIFVDGFESGNTLRWSETSP